MIKRGFTSNDIMMVVISLLIVGAMLCGVYALKTHYDVEEENAWDEFADRANDYTEYLLDKGTTGTSGYVKVDGSTYSITLGVTEKGTGTNTHYEYCWICAVEGGLELEWHTRYSDSDYITSVTYVPYDAICYTQANRIVVY